MVVVQVHPQNLDAAVLTAELARLAAHLTAGVAEGRVPAHTLLAQARVGWRRLLEWVRCTSLTALWGRGLGACAWAQRDPSQSVSISQKTPFELLTGERPFITETLLGLRYVCMRASRLRRQ